MVSNTRRATDTRRIRRLKSPHALEVESSADGTPVRLYLKHGWRQVQTMRSPWRIDQHWWRSEPVQRTYYRLMVEDEPPVTVYYDELTQTWALQAY
jgi:hypothetical protein